MGAVPAFRRDIARANAGIRVGIGGTPVVPKCAGHPLRCGSSLPLIGSPALLCTSLPQVGTSVCILLSRAMPGEFPLRWLPKPQRKGQAGRGDVAERLKRDGLRLWFDEWEIKPGDSVERTQSKTAKIGEGLERFYVLALCMSANAFGADWDLPDREMDD